MSKFIVSKDISFCYGHRLMDYVGKCRYLHGHNGVAEIRIGSNDLDHRGMVMDFSDIKRTAKEWFDHEYDHRMILRSDDPAIDFLLEQGEPILVVDFNPTAENLALHSLTSLKHLGLPIESVKFWETPTSYAEVFCDL